MVCSWTARNWQHCVLRNHNCIYNGDESISFDFNKIIPYFYKIKITWKYSPSFDFRSLILIRWGFTSPQSERKEEYTLHLWGWGCLIIHIYQLAAPLKQSFPPKHVVSSEVIKLFDLEARWSHFLLIKWESSDPSAALWWLG